MVDRPTRRKNKEHDVNEQDKTLVAKIFEHGRHSVAAKEAGLTHPGAPLNNARTEAVRRIRTQGVQDYIWEMLGEADLNTLDVLLQLKSNMFESDIKVLDMKSGEIKNLGPNWHERNRAIEIWAKMMGLMASRKGDDVKVKNKIVINWGTQKQEDDDSHTVEVEARVLSDALPQIIDQWDDDEE